MDPDCDSSDETRKRFFLTSKSGIIIYLQPQLKVGTV